MTRKPEQEKSNKQVGWYKLPVVCTVFVVQILLFSFKATAQTSNVPEVVKWEQLEKLLNKPSSDSVYVINFWATWCKPCVAELPYFDSLAVLNKNTRLKVYLISLDFKKQLTSRLIPFREKNTLDATVWLLDEPDYDSWVGKVDEKWTGSIPATVIISDKKRHRKFYEREFTFDELEKLVKPLLHP